MYRGRPRKAIGSSRSRRSLEGFGADTSRKRLHRSPSRSAPWQPTQPVVPLGRRLRPLGIQLQRCLVMKSVCVLVVSPSGHSESRNSLQRKGFRLFFELKSQYLCAVMCGPDVNRGCRDPWIRNRSRLRRRRWSSRSCSSMSREARAQLQRTGLPKRILSMGETRAPAATGGSRAWRVAAVVLFLPYVLLYLVVKWCVTHPDQVIRGVNWVIRTVGRHPKSVRRRQPRACYRCGSEQHCPRSAMGSCRWFGLDGWVRRLADVATVKRSRYCGSGGRCEGGRPTRRVPGRR